MDPERYIKNLSAGLKMANDLERVSEARGPSYDQSVRNLFRLINDKGGDYVDTEFGDMRIHFLIDLHKIVTHKD